MPTRQTPKLILHVETPREAAVRIVRELETDRKKFLSRWLANKWMTDRMERELHERDRKILGNVKTFIGGTDNE